MQNVLTVYDRGSINGCAKGISRRFSARILLYRFQLFIETTNWDKKSLLNEGFDRLCVYLLAAAMTGFLVPVFMTIAK
jgi:hypothetical protein